MRRKLFLVRCLARAWPRPPKPESEVAALTGNTASALDELEDLARALRRSRMGSKQAQPVGERE